MTYDPIKSLEVKSCGCIQQATFALTPLHALIGPNDSGKSTTLRALRAVTQFGAGNFGSASTTNPTFAPMLRSEPNTNHIKISYSDGLAYAIKTERDVYDVHESIYSGDELIFSDQSPRAWNMDGILRAGANTEARAKIPPLLAERITTATLVRFDPNALRRESKQLLAIEPIRFASDTGEGLAAVYQAINSREVDAFISIRNRVKELFPTIQSIEVPTIENHQVTIQAKLTDGTVVPAPALSEGLLYFLGFAALEHLERSTLFLVEEPENGLHPSRIFDVMTILREISKRGQVVIATHSPLVVNELEGNEVTVVTRDLVKGTQTKLLSDVPGFEDAMKIYRPGEFWVSYCDGNQEQPLLTGKPRE